MSSILIEILKSSSDVVIFIGLLLLLFVYTFSKLYGDTFSLRIKLKRNRYWETIVLVSYLFATLIIYNAFNYKHWVLEHYALAGILGVMIIGICVLLSYDFYYLYNGTSFFVRGYIRECYDILDKNSLIEQKNKIVNKPWKIIRKIDLNAYYLMVSKYYRLIDDNLMSLEYLNKIQKDLLYNDELCLFEFNYGINYVKLGAFKHAEKILYNYQNICKDYKSNPEYWLLKAFIDDSKGEIQLAFDDIKEGVSVVDANDHYLKCELYCNKSRIYSLLADEVNAIDIMRKAKLELEQIQPVKMFLYKIIYSNLALMCARKYGNTLESRALLNEYHNLVMGNHTLQNIIDYQNLAVEMQRQSGNSDYYAMIINGYRDVNSKLKKVISGSLVNSYRVANEVSSLRMLVAGCFPLQVVEKDIIQHFEYYKQLHIEERVFVYNELYCIIERMDSASQKRFHNIFEELSSYFKTDGLKDIYNIVDKLPEYAVYNYLAAVRVKIHIYKIINGKNCAKKLVELHEALVSRCEKEGLHMIEAREQLLYLDELMSAELWNPGDKVPKILLDNISILNSAEESFEHFK